MKNKRILLRRYYYYGEKISINWAFWFKLIMHEIIIEKLKKMSLGFLGAHSLNWRRQENPTTNCSSSILSDYCCKEGISIQRVFDSNQNWQNNQELKSVAWASCEITRMRDHSWISRRQVTTVFDGGFGISVRKSRNFFKEEKSISSWNC